MKKKSLIIIMLIAVLGMGLFVLAGCGNDEKTNEEQTSSMNSQKNVNSVSSSTSSKLDAENSVNKLHFKYSSNANIKDTSNGKLIEYENYKIIVSHQKDKNSKELQESRGLSLINSTNINKIDWNKYDYNDEQVSTVIYMHERDNGTYVVSISHDAGLDINLDEEIEQFMDNVRFE